MKRLQKEGYFPKFPFGTDFTDEEIILAGALKKLKGQMSSGPLNKLKQLTAAYKVLPTEKQLKLLARLDLDHPTSFKEKLLQKLICNHLQ